MTSPYPPSNPYGAPGAPQQPYGQPPQAPSQPGYGYPAQAPAPGAPAGYGYPAPAPAPAAPGYGAPAAPYGQAPYGAPMGAPMGAPTGAPPGAPVCRVCGGFPAVDATVRAHRGLIVIMQFRRQYGPFCHTCGMATVRDMSAQTLFQGWWSLYAGWVWTIITLLRNLSVYNKLKTLPPPAPGTHGPQLDPGKPLTSRPAIFMLLWPVFGIIMSIVFIVISASINSHVTNTPPYRVSLPGSSSTPGDSGSSSGGGSSGGNQTSLNLLHTGDCVTKSGTDSNANLDKVPCSNSVGVYKILGKLYSTTDSSGCDKYPDATSYFTNEETGNDFVLCMQRLVSSSSSPSS